MFEVTGEDIQRLGDGQFRTLVARLALAELAGQQLPLSVITAGGNQDAKDGGIDVRVELDRPLVSPDFVPRSRTGFQVKKPDVGPQAITKEMRPDGALRAAIGALADVGGAYIIVSAQGSVADKPLADRRRAIRDALADHPNSDNLFVDFYDRERIATWANVYPGVITWVRNKVGGEVSGWRPIGVWFETGITGDGGFLASGSICLIDERSKERETLTVFEGIARMRTSLLQPGHCLRLIGMSGLGKTRLVEALFEPGVGTVPLDPALSVYTDYADHISPSAREMAHRLVDSGNRAILIVDNCNPAIHAELSTICTKAGSKVSLLTVEYDVRDDQPESTEVFRLTRAADELVEQWLERDFKHLSQVDRARIAEFSDGNFRVGRALAETVRHGETLGQLRNRDLFERIFHQRNAPDGELLHHAEVLALVYSFDGEDDRADSELARLADFSGRSLADLFGAIAELRKRGIIQSRGRWRAVLPQAIANRLAGGALDRLPPGTIDDFSSSLPYRMLKSLSRRLGYLHDNATAQATVARWLSHAGPLGDLFGLSEARLEIVQNIAPVAPEIVLTKVAEKLDDSRGSDIFATTNPLRWRWIALLRSLAYESTTFALAAKLLARFIAAEPVAYNNNSATRPFEELFQLYLSGTQASPAQRREVVRALLGSDDPSLNGAGMLALGGLMKSGEFNSTASFDFGARSRDFGWQPLLNGDIFAWYSEAIALSTEFLDQHADAKTILARNVRDLWSFPKCQDALEHASKRLAAVGGWIDGWIGFRAALQFDGANMPDDIRQRLRGIVDLLKPVDLIDRARAFVLTRGGGYDIVDGEADTDAASPWDRASQTAVDIGKAIATDRALLLEFLPEVISQEPPQRVYEFGRGLAQGAANLRIMWADMRSIYHAAVPDQRNATVLGGFLYEAHRRDENFAQPVLDAAMRDLHLARQLPWLQACVALDKEGLARLTTAAREALISAPSYVQLATGVIADAPAEPLVAMLGALANLDKGVGVAIDILHMRFYMQDDIAHSEESLIVLGRELLKRADFSDKHVTRDYGLRSVAELCLSGPDAAEDARIVCANLREALNQFRVSTHDVNELLVALFKTQPTVALDTFLLGNAPLENYHLLELRSVRASPIEGIEGDTLCAWAAQDPANRFLLLGRALALFSRKELDESAGLSPLFLAVMAKAPNKQQFLGDVWHRVYPRGWNGSIADILERRKGMLDELLVDADSNVQAWVHDTRQKVDDWIVQERGRESGREERFE